MPDPPGPDVEDGVAERVDAAAAGGRAAPAVADLPAEQRKVLLLVARTDLDYAGIARALGVPAAPSVPACTVPASACGASSTGRPGGSLRSCNQSHQEDRSDMNELDLVRGVAADTAGPDVTTTQAARARLLAVIAAEP